LGGLTLTPEGARALENDLTLLLGALGARGRLVEPVGGSGSSLAIETDAYWTRTSSGAVPGLAAAEADATRLRLGLEGGYRLALDAGGTLEPIFEIGVRHHGGDAETGNGMDLGGGLAWTDPALGLSAALSARGLLSRGFGDVGLSGSLAWDPDPSSDRGPSLTVTQTLGGSASGGMHALLARPTLAVLAVPEDALERRRPELRAGYGFGRSATASPPSRRWAGSGAGAARVPPGLALPLGRRRLDGHRDRPVGHPPRAHHRRRGARHRHPHDGPLVTAANRSSPARTP